MDGWKGGGKEGVVYSIRVFGRREGNEMKRE